MGGAFSTSFRTGRRPQPNGRKAACSPGLRFATLAPLGLWLRHASLRSLQPGFVCFLLLGLLPAGPSASRSSVGRFGRSFLTPASGPAVSHPLSLGSSSLRSHVPRHRPLASPRDSCLRPACGRAACQLNAGCLSLRSFQPAVATVVNARPAACRAAASPVNLYRLAYGSSYSC